MSGTYDVAIVGGGPAGAAAAIQLARAGRRIVLLDASLDESFRIGETLPPAAKRLLVDLGVFERFTADGHLPSYGNESAWGASFLHATDFIHDPDGCGWRLDRVRFDRMLREEARIRGAKLEHARALKPEQVGDEWDVETSGERVRVRFLLDCSGRASWLASRGVVGRSRHDDLIAIYGVFCSPAGTDSDSRTRIESRPEGWWYTVRLPAGGRRLAVFFTDAQHAACARARFLDLLEETEHIRRVIAEHGYTIHDSSRITAANSACLQTFVGDHWLAAGDAAIACDPLSSQGILNALYSGVQAAAALNAAAAGDAGALSEYGRLMNRVQVVYQRNLNFYYAAERRWPDADFWARRQAALTSAAEV